jgi:hypothetical protein
MELIGGARFQFGNDMEVEVTRFGSLGVNQLPSGSDLIADAQLPGDCIAQKSRTDPAPFVVNGDAEPGQQRQSEPTEAGNTSCVDKPADFR